MTSGSNNNNHIVVHNVIEWWTYFERVAFRIILLLTSPKKHIDKMYFNAFERPNIHIERKNEKLKLQ
jgi:hypothetical protein